MSKVISKESVRRANTKMIHKQSQCVSIDGKNVSVRCHTVVGECTMTFSRERIVEEARKAFIKVVK